MRKLLSVVIGVPLSWLLLQSFHEAGHVLAAIASGGVIRKVVLHPLALSRTELSLNPHPTLVVWAGSLLGSLLPIAMWALARPRYPRLATYLRFFAGFCLVGNGVYYIVGTLDPGADPGDALKLGTPPAVNYLFGILAVIGGFWLWNGQAPALGFGNAGREVTWAIPIGLLMALCLTIGLQLRFCDSDRPLPDDPALHHEAVRNAKALP